MCGISCDRTETDDPPRYFVGRAAGSLNFVSPANSYSEEYPALADLITQFRSSYSNDIVPEVRYDALTQVLLFVMGPLTRANVRNRLEISALPDIGFHPRRCPIDCASKGTDSDILQSICILR